MSDDMSGEQRFWATQLATVVTGAVLLAGIAAWYNSHTPVQQSHSDQMELEQAQQETYNMKAIAFDRETELIMLKLKTKLTSEPLEDK